MKRPNIVLIELARSWSLAWSLRTPDTNSPRIDEPAAAGIVFDNYFCTAPQCSPSRASMMTGLVPHATGVLALTHRGFDINCDTETLPQVLRHHGYTIHLFGPQHDCGDPSWEGYDSIRAKCRSARYVASEPKSFFANLKADDTPFFRPHGESFDVMTDCTDRPGVLS